MAIRRQTCSESSLDFHTVRTDASYGINGGGIRFSDFGNQFYEVKQRPESRKLSYGEGILAYIVHTESDGNLIGKPKSQNFVVAWFG